MQPARNASSRELKMPLNDSRSSEYANVPFTVCTPDMDYSILIGPVRQDGLVFANSLQDLDLRFWQAGRNAPFLMGHLLFRATSQMRRMSLAAGRRDSDEGARDRRRSSACDANHRPAAS